jgi:hypothetical protein
MSYKIPPPWQSNYAIPAYVRAEGMRTRAFVTKWAPRGTYDDPDAFDPSWDSALAIPQYIKDEGYGQGAKVTEWAPRGTYAGGNKPAAKSNGKKVALGDFAGATLPASYNRFGQRAAAVILKRVGPLPTNSRRDALRKILDVIDKDLWSRSSQLAAELERKGVAPATAVQTALARAMSEGAAREVVETGKRRTLPQARTVMGLGIYGARAALGATFSIKDGLTTRADAEMGLAKPPPGPTAGQCLVDSADPNNKRIWRAATATVEAHWERPRAGEVCTSTYGAFAAGAASEATRVTVAGTNLTPAEAAAQGLKFIRVGGWVMQDKEGDKAEYNKALTTAAHRATILNAVMKASLFAIAGLRNAGPYTDSNSNFVRFGTLGLGFDPPAGQASYDHRLTPEQIAEAIAKSPLVWKGAIDGSIPIGKFTHPVSKKLCVIHARIGGAGDAEMAVWWKVYQKSLWEWLIDSLVGFVATVFNVVVDAIKEVANLACDLATSTTGQMGAQIALTAGTNAAAGAAGASIIQSACSSPTAPPPPPPEDTTPEWLVPVAIGGAILAGVILLLPKKRKSS